MTEQEAIEKLNMLDEALNFQRYDADECSLALQMASEALEKQIPKELTNIRKVKEYDGYDMGCCPVCGEPLDNSFYENLKYCFVCGQAINWE